MESDGKVGGVRCREMGRAVFTLHCVASARTAEADSPTVALRLRGVSNRYGVRSSLQMIGTKTTAELLQLRRMH